MSSKGIPLGDILGSPLVLEKVKVSGIEGLRKLADEQAARVGVKPAAIHIVHNTKDTTIDISLSSVTEMSDVLLAIGYTKKGILNRIIERVWMT